MAAYTGKNILLFDELPSTNTYASGLLKEKPEEGTVIQTLFQSAGKGQKGSKWEVMPGVNLTLSVIYYPSFLDLQRVFQLSKLVALAVHKALSRLLPQSGILIKWPNDVLLDGKKVAGILLENQLEGKKIKSSIIGVGINVNQMSFPEELAHKATSLKLAFGSAFSLEEVRQLLFEELEKGYEELKRRAYSQLDREYLKHLYGYQEEVEVAIKGQQTKAIVAGVGMDGRLALAIDGVLTYFDIKEVSWVL